MAAHGGSPVAVGLVGAGPWARQVHAPGLAAGPETRLAGIWARRPDAAQELAARHGVKAYGRMSELLEECEGVSFAVPPAVQGELAAVAARSGRALLLEKPLAADLGQAYRLAEAIGQAGVPSQMALTLRYAPAVRAFLSSAPAIEPFGGYALWLSGGALHGPFATAWRRERGAILDVGPHVIDLLDAALGRIVDVRAHGTCERWTGLLMDHDCGAVSEVVLCTTAPIDSARFRVEICGTEGTAFIDETAVGPETWPTLLREFAGTVRSGEAHPLDAQHGLRIQTIIDAAERSLSP